VAKNEYLIMDDEELEAIQLESSHTIDIPDVTIAPDMLQLAQHIVEQKQGMIFGNPPDFEAVLVSISSLETRLNNNGARERGAAR
jgi:non-homologous end joining protein Ku